MVFLDSELFGAGGEFLIYDIQPLKLKTTGKHIIDIWFTVVWYLNLTQFWEKMKIYQQNWWLLSNN